MYIPVYVGLVLCGDRQYPITHFYSEHCYHSHRNTYALYTDQLLFFFRVCSIYHVQRQNADPPPTPPPSQPPPSTLVSNVMLKTLQINNRKLGGSRMICFLVCTRATWSVRRHTVTSFEFRLRTSAKNRIWR